MPISSVFFNYSLTICSRTFSLCPILVHKYIDDAADGAITIVYGDCDNGDEDGRSGVRRAAKAGGYCATKVTPPIASFAMGGAQETKKVSVVHHFQLQIVLKTRYCRIDPVMKLKFRNCDGGVAEGKGIIVSASTVPVTYLVIM